MSRPCPHCGDTGRARWKNGYLAIVAAVLWLFPLGFLAQGFYPFLIVPAVALSVWAVISVRPECPACGKPRRR